MGRCCGWHVVLTEVIVLMRRVALRQLTFGGLLCRATALHENFVTRLKILADLHWSHERPLSAAETRFNSHVLPELEDTTAAIQRDVRVRGLHPLQALPHALDFTPPLHRASCKLPTSHKRALGGCQWH